MTEKLRPYLPPIYQPLVGDAFDAARPNETRATCDTCAMCDHGAPAPIAMEYFLPDTKCCTYFPQLPNYLVGAILEDPSPDAALGKERIREVIARRIGTTPHYLSRPRKTSLVMLGYAEAFGRTKTLLCPYFDASKPDKSCSIWRHRESVCMTYHCKYADGQRGFGFWSALKSYLAHVQRALVRPAAEAVDARVIEPVFAQNALTLEDIEDRPPKDSDYAKWWGQWVGREDEFYVHCYRWVAALSPEVFRRNVDETADGKRLVGDLRSRQTQLATRVLPTSLVKNARMKEDHVGEKVVVTTYHRYDAFSLDKDLYDVVGLFRSDETLAQNLERLKGEGIELTPDLVEFLYVAGVLVEPKSAPSAP